MENEVTAASPASVQTENGDGKAANMSMASLLTSLQKPQNAEAAEETTAETVEAEQTTQEPEQAPEEVLSQSEDNDIPPEIQEKVNKRIGKEVAKRKSAEEAHQQALQQAKAYEAELTELRTKASSPAYSPLPPDPLGHIEDVAALQKHYEECKEARRLAEELLEDGVPEDGIEYEGRKFTRENLIEIKRNAARAIEDHIPKRQQFLQLRETVNKDALSKFDWFSNKESKEYKTYDHLKKSYPWINKMPDAALWLGITVEGLKAMDQKTLAQKAKPKPPADQTASGGSVSSTSRADSKTQEAKAKQVVMRNLSTNGNLTKGSLAKMLLKQP